MSDVCDGHYYSSHPVFSCNDKALQIVAYYDELVLTNPLMSRRNNYKIGKFYSFMHVIIHHYYVVGAIYFMLGNLDPSVRSRLENIHLVALFKSTLLQMYSFDDILAPLVSELKILANVSCNKGCLVNVYTHSVYSSHSLD